MAIFAICDSAIINVMNTAAIKAAKGLVRDFGELEHLQVSRKGLGDFVSVADKRCEKTLVYELSKARPDYNFITEETGEIKNSDSDFTWVIDPLDGTSNFLHAIPHFAIAIALMRKNDVIAALTYDPMKDEMFWAEKGKGAFLNKRRLRVSKRKELDACIASVGYFPHAKSDDLLKRFSCFDSLGGIRNMGSAALDLAYLAAGRLDAYAFAGGLKIWDMAGGILMAKEAGGIVTEVAFGSKMLENGSIFAANANIHQDFHNALNKK